jgi:hypothetical protein
VRAAAASVQSSAGSIAPAGGHADKCDDATDADGRASKHGAVYARLFPADEDDDDDDDEATVVSSAAQLHSKDQQSSAGAALTNADHCAAVHASEASGHAAHEADEAEVPNALRVRGHHCNEEDEEEEEDDRDAAVLPVPTASASNDKDASRISGCAAGHSSGPVDPNPSSPLKDDDDDEGGLGGANREAAATGVETTAARGLVGAVALPSEA